MKLIAESHINDQMVIKIVGEGIEDKTSSITHATTLVLPKEWQEQITEAWEEESRLRKYRQSLLTKFKANFKENEESYLEKAKDTYPELFL